MLFRSHPSLELTKKFAVTPELVRALLTTIFVDANKQVHLVYIYIYVFFPFLHLFRHTQVDSRCGALSYHGRAGKLLPTRDNSRSLCTDDMLSTPA